MLKNLLSTIDSAEKRPLPQNAARQDACPTNDLRRKRHW